VREETEAVSVPVTDSASRQAVGQEEGSSGTPSLTFPRPDGLPGSESGAGDGDRLRPQRVLASTPGPAAPAASASTPAPGTEVASVPGVIPALLFQVGDIELAAPLQDLGGISVIDDSLQPVAGQAPWFMGLMRWNGRNLRVVDTWQFLMPEREYADGHRQGYRSVVVLGDSNWALAVNVAQQSVRLESSQLRLRQQRSGRPWQAGTLLESLCTLLDVAALQRMLDASEVPENGTNSA
jgi:chemotaxis signal transduction protein